MLINKKDVMKYAGILGKAILPASGIENYAITFPIDTTKVMNDSGIELTLKANDSGAAKDPDAMLILTTEEYVNKKGEKDIRPLVMLAYGDLNYARKFDFMQFAEMLGIKIAKSKDIGDLECMLIDKRNILTEFRL